MPKTLLLADDSVVIQKLVGLSFANEDVKLVTTDNGDDALRRVREISPDLVLADVVMPGKNGYELCEAIKADPQLAHTPVLLLTGTFEAFDEERARQVGSDGHITKPFEAQGLVDRANELLSRAAPVQPAAAPAAAAPAPRAPSTAATDTSDETYDFFDDEASPLSAPDAPAADVSTTDSFEFGSADFDTFGDDDDPLSGEDFDASLDSDFDLEPSPSDDLSAMPPRPAPAPIAAPQPAQPLAATVITDGLDAPSGDPSSITDDDLFADPPARLAPPTQVPVTSARESAPVSIPTTPGSPQTARVDDDLDFGFDEPEPMPAATNASPAPPAGAPVAFGSIDPVRREALPPAAPTPPPAVDPAPIAPPEREPVVDRPPPVPTPPALASEPPKAPAATPLPEPPVALAIESDRDSDSAVDLSDSSYDVSVSDLGEPPSAPIRSGGAVVAPSVSSPAASLSPVLRDRIHETLEKVAWEAFADLSDTIVRQVLNRVESTVWEIVPQMAEALIQEEIRRMKGEDD